MYLTLFWTIKIHTDIYNIFTQNSAYFQVTIDLLYRLNLKVAIAHPCDFTADPKVGE